LWKIGVFFEYGLAGKISQMLNLPFSVKGVPEKNDPKYPLIKYFQVN
jgi:hypothetical protein